MSTLAETRQNHLNSSPRFHHIAIAGASGYVGSRLVERLIAGGRAVHTLSRSARAPIPDVTSFRADVQDPASLLPALRGIDSAVYLVHGMAEEGDFAELEARGARNFAAACAEAGVRRIVFLGALGDDGDDLMREYARQRGLRRLMIPVPVLTPRLSSLWLRLVTPATAQIGRHLVEGLRNATVVRDRKALEDFAVRPMDFPEAMARAISGEAK